VCRRSGAAAAAKYASETADQTAAASVLKPSGARRSVTGSSFMAVRKTIADSVQAQVMGELRGEPLLYQGLDTLTRTITVAAGGAGASMGLEGIIYEKLSGKVADGIGDAVKIRS
jgi:hypothetical protein